MLLARSQDLAVTPGQQAHRVIKVPQAPQVLLDTQVSLDPVAVRADQQVLQVSQVLLGPQAHQA